MEMTGIEDAQSDGDDFAAGGARFFGAMGAGQRALDLAVAVGGCVLLSPLMSAIAVWIRLDSPGPALYRARRVGKDGAPFWMLKFRTMKENAEAEGAGITSRDDPRVTRAGAFLRRYKLDELPQLWNVVRGEMSLVGPRPEDPRYVEWYTPRQRAVLTVPPGMTGAASVRFRHEERWLAGADGERTYREVVLPRKLEIELGYLRRRTFWSDLGILWETVRAVSRKEGEDDATG
jgi:lipopolysaccharide/colanic/teichoic acid biosynthesis glycosyltransferase